MGFNSGFKGLIQQFIDLTLLSVALCSDAGSVVQTRGTRDGAKRLRQVFKLHDT